MFAVNLIAWLTRAFELIYTDDALVTENDHFTQSLAGTIADALTSAVVERKARFASNPVFNAQLVQYRTVVHALRAIERNADGRTALDGDASRAVMALALEQQIDAALRVDAGSRAANEAAITARVLARAELGLSDKSDW